MIGGYPTADWYEKDGGKLPKDYIHEITKEDERFGVITLANENSVNNAYTVLLKNTDGYINPWIKRVIIAAIIIAIISLIYYKHKH